MRFTTTTLMILLVGASVAWATTPDNLEPLRCKEVLQIQQAARTKDPVLREQALRQSIRDGLLSTDPAVRREVFSYLSEVGYRWLDLRPFVDVLEEYASRPDSHGHGRQLADDVELFGAPREDRIEVYRRAMIEGEVRLKRGTPLDRWNAVRGAAWQGLDELRPLIETYYTLTPELAADTPIEQLRLWLDLRAGARDREDALRLASERLARLDASEFASRIDSDPIFKQTVLQTARDACAINPFTGERNSGCCAIGEIAARQKRLHDQRDAEMKAAGTPPAPVEIGGPSTWLDQLREVSQPVRLSPPQGQGTP